MFRRRPTRLLPLRQDPPLSYGNASQPGSPHVGDQLELFARKELRPVWRTRAEIEAHLEERETIVTRSESQPRLGADRP